MYSGLLFVGFYVGLCCIKRRVMVIWSCVKLKYQEGGFP